MGKLVSNSPNMLVLHVGEHLSTQIDYEQTLKHECQFKVTFLP